MPELTASVLAHRVDRIRAIGFTQAQAAELACARDSRGFLVDIHELRRVVTLHGCNTDTAFAIYA